MQSDSGSGSSGNEIVAVDESDKMLSILRAVDWCRYHLYIMLHTDKAESFSGIVCVMCYFFVTNLFDWQILMNCRIAK